jgi:peptidyl-prolyl cis-trans isomerase B (cyclophilin B)
MVAALVITGAAGLGFVLTSDSSSTDDSAAASACGFRSSGGGQDVDAGIPELLEPGDGAQATITLNGDPVVVDLNGDTAPCAVSSWAHLAEQDYFDGTSCHRLTTSPTLNVLQCGDPSGTGVGGPGYRFDDESLDTAAYPPGTVAMANSGPDSNGSQFFFVWDNAELPPSYTVVGSVISGLETVQDIAEAGVSGDGTDGAPATAAVIDDLEVSGL